MVQLKPHLIARILSHLPFTDATCSSRNAWRRDLTNAALVGRDWRPEAQAALIDTLIPEDDQMIYKLLGGDLLERHTTSTLGLGRRQAEKEPGAEYEEGDKQLTAGPNESACLALLHRVRGVKHLTLVGLEGFDPSWLASERFAGLHSLMLVLVTFSEARSFVARARGELETLFIHAQAPSNIPTSFLSSNATSVKWFGFHLFGEPEYDVEPFFRTALPLVGSSLETLELGFFEPDVPQKIMPHLRHLSNLTKLSYGCLLGDIYDLPAFIAALPGSTLKTLDLSVKNGDVSLFMEDALGGSNLEALEKLEVRAYEGEAEGEAWESVKIYCENKGIELVLS